MSDQNQAVENHPVLAVPIGTIAVAPKKLIEVRADTTIETVLGLMAKYKITSVPVRGNGDAQTPGDPAECLGMVNLMDVVAYAVFAIGEGDPNLRVDVNNLFRLDDAIVDVIGSYSAEGTSEWSFQAYSEDEPLANVLYPFCAGVHRVLVSNANGRGKEGLLSQTNIVTHLHEHRGELPELILNAPPSRRRSSEDSVPLTMDTSEHALTGYRRMVLESRSSVGVVNGEGTLVGNLSLSDLRGISKETFVTLAEPVEEYLAARGARSVVTLREDATVAAIMAVMVDSHIHRVWLVDADGKPKSQVSMTDIILEFADLTLPLVLPTEA